MNCRHPYEILILSSEGPAVRGNMLIIGLSRTIEVRITASL